MTDSETFRRGIAIAARRELDRTSGVQNREGWLVWRQRELRDMIGDERPPTAVDPEGFADWVTEFLGLSAAVAKRRYNDCRTCDGTGWSERMEWSEHYKQNVSMARPCPDCDWVARDVGARYGIDLSKRIPQ